MQTVVADRDKCKWSSEVLDLDREGVEGVLDTLIELVSLESRKASSIAKICQALLVKSSATAINLQTLPHKPGAFHHSPTLQHCSIHERPAHELLPARASSLPGGI